MRKPVVFDQGDRGAAVVAACRRLHSAIDALDQRAADMLGLARGDLRCLNLLEAGSATPTRIAAGLGLSTGSVTALIDRLERKGLVERSRDPSDRRGVLVTATPVVFETIGALYAKCSDLLRATVASYPLPEQDAAVRHLNDVALGWERGADKDTGVRTERF
jgi:DNA-binding MarR family transcriptional regulator